MAEVIVMQWLRPHLERERWELESLQLRAREIRELAQPLYCCTLQLYGINPACETYREYLAMLSEDMCEIRDHARGCTALRACCRDK